MKKKTAPKAAEKKIAPKPEAISKDIAAEKASEETIVPQGLSRNERLHLVLFFVAVSFAMMVTTGTASMVILALFLVFSLRKNCWQVAREQLSLPMAGVFCMLALYGMSAIHSPFGATARLELYRGIAAMVLAGYAMLHFRKKHVPALLWGYVAIVTVYTLLSIDMAAGRVLYQPAHLLMNLFDVNLEGVSPFPDGRLYGLLNNSNVLAGIAASALIVGLYQMQTEKGKIARALAAICLGINAVAFWLGFSRGGMLCFGISMILYLVLTRKGERLRVFLLMLICVAVAVAAGTIASPMMRDGSGGSILATLLALVCGLVILVLDSLISVRLSAALVRHHKALLITGGVAAVAAVALVVCAFTISGSCVLPQGTWGRAVDLDGGKTYTVSGDWDGNPNVVVRIERKGDLLMDWHTDIYEGPLAEAEFSLPEDTATVKLYFKGEGGEELREVTFSDGTSVKLNLKLLPETLESRLQDNLLTSSSLLLRVQYVKDALKIWAVSPLFGRGLTSTDNLYTSVQPAYYQSKFAHCHVVQYLADMGIIGVACFLLIVVSLAWLMLRKWKENRDPLAATLLTALFMVNFHSLMEINFSVRAYVVTAYVLMGIMAIVYGEPILLKGKAAVKKAGTAVATGAYVVAAALFAICMASRLVENAADKFQTPDHASFMKQVETFIALDMLDDDYYKILYLSQNGGMPEYEMKVAKYAQELRNSGTFTNCDAVARYYYVPRGLLDEAFVCSMEGIAQKAADKESWNGEFDFYRARILKMYSKDWTNARGPFIEGVLMVRDYLAQYSQGRMEEIQLTEENQAFLAAVETIWQNPGMTDEESLALLEPYTFAESEA